MTEAQELLARISRQQEDVAALKELYAETFPPEYMEDNQQFRVGPRRYDFDIIVASFDALLTGSVSATRRLRKLRQQLPAPSHGISAH
jgi:hypothetical protein